MNYQEILCYPYVLNLINSLIKPPQNHNLQHGLVENSIVEIVKLDDTFYIKDTCKNLYLIQPEMINNNDIKVLLNTCIHFEKYKDKPMESFLKLRYIQCRQRIMDIELLKHLELKYIIDKSYFENKKK